MEHRCRVIWPEIPCLVLYTTDAYSNAHFSSLGRCFIHLHSISIQCWDYSLHTRLKAATILLLNIPLFSNSLSEYPKQTLNHRSNECMAGVDHFTRTSAFCRLRFPSPRHNPSKAKSGLLCCAPMAAQALLQDKL